ncbi:hypothetical protein [Maribacter sp. ACAM166]|uniref:hypothetical protein n=1 Tax=Maribacter sp. ACAM166 TaxID=2508996 RepID=UPI0010FE4B2D|nr:hypothetical protein [Maribacter sp. ACAM166]TLP77574.1 hypothetical protein ES765_12465 [Maribacter sp. ACAM166]
MKKLIVLMLVVLTYSIGYAQSDSLELTNETTVERQKEFKLVKKKVEKSEAAAKKAKKEVADLKKKEKFKKRYNVKEKSIIKQEKQIYKLKNQLEKGKLKGTLAPVDIQKMSDKIVKIKLKVMNEEEKLKKVKHKM